MMSCGLCLSIGRCCLSGDCLRGASCFSCCYGLVIAFLMGQSQVCAVFVEVEDVFSVMKNWGRFLLLKSFFVCKVFFFCQG